MNCKYKIGDKVKLVTETVTDVLIYEITKVNSDNIPCRYSITDEDGNTVIEIREDNLDPIEQ